MKRTTVACGGTTTTGLKVRGKKKECKKGRTKRWKETKINKTKKKAKANPRQREGRKDLTLKRRGGKSEPSTTNNWKEAGGERKKDRGKGRRKGRRGRKKKSRGWEKGGPQERGRQEEVSIVKRRGSTGNAKYNMVSDGNNLIITIPRACRVIRRRACT